MRYDRRVSSPNPAAFGALMSRANEGPVTMLNLLALRSDGGREGYAAYAKAVAPLLSKAGGEVVFAGSGQELLIGSTTHGWDMVLLVRYPTRAAFMSMVTSEAYREIQHLRDDALEDSVLLSMDDVKLGAAPAGIDESP